MRWDHPARGLLAPREFLLDEDDNALLVRIGWSVVIEAVQRAGHWRRTFPDRPITVSVNLSAGHLERRDLSARSSSCCSPTRSPGPRALAFEVGERHLLSRRLRARDRLTALRNLGVDIVVDDFGATAAATDVGADELRDSALELLESLAKFPLDVVKLDPRFVTRLGTDARIAEVVDAAHAVGPPRRRARGRERGRRSSRDARPASTSRRVSTSSTPNGPAYVDRLLADR